MDWLKVLTQDMRRALPMCDLREFGELSNQAYESKQQTRCSRVKWVPLVARATFLRRSQRAATAATCGKRSRPEATKE